MDSSLGNDQWQDHKITVLAFGFHKMKGSVSLTYYWGECCTGKAISITQTECVFIVLAFQNAMRMNLFSYETCPPLHYFSTLSHKWHDFREKRLLNIKCVFRFSLQRLSKTFFILGRNERDMIINVYLSSCKVLAILVRFQWNLNFPNRFSKNTEEPNFMKIPPIEAEFFFMRKDGQTDIAKLIVAFRNFVNVSKNGP